VRTQTLKGTEGGVISFPGIRSRDALWCAQKRAHPTRFKDLDNIVQVEVPEEILDLASQRWSNLDGQGPAVGFIDEGLEAFNEAIISITELLE